MIRTLLVIDNPFILITGLILFIMGYYIAHRYDIRWLYAISGLLWLIPIFMIENIFIVIFSVVMLIVSIIIAFYKE